MAGAISPDRFDGAAVWASLTDEQKAMIGAAALELVAAWWCQEQAADPLDGSDPLLRAADAADRVLLEQIRLGFVAAVPRERVCDGENRPLLPSLLGPVCRQCGCSEMDACRDGFAGCAWAEPDLCSVCAKGGA